MAHCHLAGICLFSLQTKFPWHCAARRGGKHPWWLGTPGTCCCHRAPARGAKNEVTGANSPSPASCLVLSAHSRRWSNSTKPSFCSKYTFPTSPASSLPPPLQFFGDKPAAGRVLLCQGTAESLCQGLPRALGWQWVPTTALHTLTAALLAGLMGRAGSIKFPVIPEPAQMSSLIICCVGSLPAPCHCLHSTGCWRSVQNHKPEPPMAGPTCPPTSARSLPISGGIPPASLSLGVLSFPKHRFQAHAHIPPVTSLLPAGATPGSGHPAWLAAGTAAPTGSTDATRFAGGALEHNSAKD